MFIASAGLFLSAWRWLLPGRHGTHGLRDGAGLPLESADRHADDLRGVLALIAAFATRGGAEPTRYPVGYVGDQRERAQRCLIVHVAHYSRPGP